MQISQLPDGTWATSPIYMGFGLRAPCPDAEHQWEVEPGSKMPIPEENTDVPGVTHMCCQVCKKCTYRRFAYTKEG